MSSSRCCATRVLAISGCMMPPGPFGAYCERVIITMYLELASVKIYLEILLGSGLGYGPRVLGRVSVVTRLRHCAEGPLTFPRGPGSGLASGTGSRIAGV